MSSYLTLSDSGSTKILFSYVCLLSMLMVMVFLISKCVKVV